MAVKTIQEMSEEAMRESLRQLEEQKLKQEQAHALRQQAYALEREASKSSAVVSYAATFAANNLFGVLRYKGEAEEGGGKVYILEDTPVAQALRHMQLTKTIRRKALLDLYDLRPRDLNAAEGNVIRVSLGDNPGFQKQVRYVTWTGPTIQQTVMAIPLVKSEYGEEKTWDQVFLFWERKLDEGSAEAATWLEVMRTVERVRGSL